MIILYTGDWHVRGTQPRNRKDNYLESFLDKLKEVLEKAVEFGVKYIVVPGDVNHTPELSINTLLTVAEVLKKSPVKILTSIGNHDCFSYNVDTYYRTSLRLLELLVPQLEVINGVYVDTDGTIIDFVPYTTANDIDGSEYRRCPSARISVVHGMLLDHDLPYQAKYTNLYNLETNADIILSGHFHEGFGVIKRDDGKLFVNPGALMRLTASKAEMERAVQVAIIDTDTRTAELIPLKTAKPADEVLDRSKLEANLDRQYAMEEFSALIKTDTGHAVMNIPDIVENIAKQEDIPETVVKKTLELLEVKDSAKG